VILPGSKNSATFSNRDHLISEEYLKGLRIMGKFLDENISKQIQEAFANLVNPVKVFVFTSKKDCEYCEDTRELLEEVCGLSDKLNYRSLDNESDAEVAKQYKIERTPAIAVLAEVDGKTIDHGIRFSGIPAGHEFSALIHSIISVSRQEPGISQETQAFLDSLKKPVHLEIFTTPT
jgi:glutaredoxin-like protein